MNNISRYIPIDGADAWTDIQAIHAVMAYPEKPLLAGERFWAPIWMDRALNLAKGETLAVKKTDLLAMLRAPAADEVIEASRQQSIKGQIAGHILLLCIAMADTGLPVSRRQATYLLEQYYPRVRRAQQHVVRASVRTIDSAWKSHQSVAHLWAARSVLVLQNPNEYEHLSPINLPDFLAWCEWFRVRGESLIPPRQRPGKPILDPERTWCCPDGLIDPLPDCAAGFQLPEWTLSALQDYQNKS